MKIQFTESCWVIQQIVQGGFASCYNIDVFYVNKDEIYKVISIEKNKKTQCSQIHISNQEGCSGTNRFFINVPNGLFRIIP